MPDERLPPDEEGRDTLGAAEWKLGVLRDGAEETDGRDGATDGALGWNVGVLRETDGAAEWKLGVLREGATDGALEEKLGRDGALDGRICVCDGRLGRDDGEAAIRAPVAGDELLKLGRDAEEGALDTLGFEARNEGFPCGTFAAVAGPRLTDAMCAGARAPEAIADEGIAIVRARSRP